MCLAALACTWAANTARAAEKATVIVVIGAEGTPEFGDTFNKAADKWQDAATKAEADFLMIGARSASSRWRPCRLESKPATHPAYKDRLQELDKLPPAGESCRRRPCGAEPAASG